MRWNKNTGEEVEVEEDPRGGDTAEPQADLSKAAPGDLEAPAAEVNPATCTLRPVR